MRKKNDKTIVITFICLIVISLIIGFFIGGLSNRLSSSQTVAQLFTTLTENVIRIMPYAALLLNIILCIIAFCIYGKCQKMSETWDGENEDVIDKIEGMLNIAMIIPSIMMILNFLFFGIGFAVDTSFKKGFTLENIGLGIAFATFILSFVWETILQGKVVGLEKKLNPEKRGNILDLKFRSEWIESCDEAERMTLYRAGYDVYKLMANMYVYAWLLTFIVSAATGTGLFAMVVVTILWLVQTVTYFSAAAKHQ